jgi:hypothetical protein
VDERHSVQRGELPAPHLYGPLAADATLLDHFRDDALILLDEREAIEAALSDLDDLARERREELVGRNELRPDAPLNAAGRRDRTRAADAPR